MKTTKQHKKAKTNPPYYRLPKKYLTKNAAVPENLKTLLRRAHEIHYITIVDGFIRVITTDGREEPFSITLCSLMPWLCGSKFLRVEADFVVNPAYITDLIHSDCGWMLYLGENIKIPVWAKMEKVVKKYKMQNAGKQYLFRLFATRQQKTPAKLIHSQ